MENTVILVDKLFNLEKIKSTPKDSIIISLDVISHFNLDTLEIKHELIEDYLSKDDIKKIDDFCFDLTFNSLCSDSTYSLLKYDGFHLGELFRNDFLLFLLKIMKYFVGVTNILKKIPNKKIICTKSISNIITNFDIDKKISLCIVPEHVKVNNDKFTLPISLGKKTINLNISMVKAQKAVHLLHKTFNLLYNFQFNKKKDIHKSFVILLDLNPFAFSDFFKSLGKNENILLIDEFIPPIWNKKNIDTLKHSNVKIIKLESILNKKIEQKISDTTNKIMLMIEDLPNNDHFMQIFLFEGYSIWPLIQDYFKQQCVEKFFKAIRINELTKDFFTKIKIDKIVCLYNAVPETQMLLHNAEKNKIPYLKIPHGYPIKTPTAQKISIFETLRSQPNIQFSLWGESEVKFWENLGTKNENLMCPGYPPYDKLFIQKSQKPSENLIFIGTTFLQFIWSLSGHDTNTSILHRNSIVEICKICNEYQNKKTIIKIHPSVNPSFNLQSELLKSKINIPIFKTQDVTELMKKSDVIICLDFSSILFEAMILGKPTITYIVDPTWYSTDEIIKSKYTIPVRNITEFKEALDHILNDKNFRNNLVNNAKTFVNSRLKNQGNASMILSNYVSNMKLK